MKKMSINKFFFLLENLSSETAFINHLNNLEADTKNFDQATKQKIENYRKKFLIKDNTNSFEENIRNYLKKKGKI